LPTIWRHKATPSSRSTVHPAELSISAGVFIDPSSGPGIVPWQFAVDANPADV
jgi:hypothetical protein